MALADSKTMKAMVEFREHTGSIKSSGLLYGVSRNINQKITNSLVALKRIELHDFISKRVLTLISCTFLQVNQRPAAQMPADSVVRGMELNCLQWEVFVQTQTARYFIKYHQQPVS